MRHFINGRFRQQFTFLSRQFLQDNTLPLSNVLSKDVVAEVLKDTECSWVDRIYSPLVTVWVFLVQVLSADHSCRWAVSRLIVQRISQGQDACSAETGAYCRARKRLPEKLFSEVARKTGQELDANTREDWLWKDRPVYAFDGTTVIMPDTPENQKAYPQADTQKPGLGFPMARIVAIFSLSCGAVVDLAIGRYAGKAQGESSLFRTIWDVFRPGDIVLTDALLCTWAEILLLKQRGVDFVGQLHVLLEVRECCISIQQPGFRSKNIVVVTTLLDAVEFTKEDIAELYFRRWNVELDLRSLKTVMQMEMLRCKTPELVRKGNLDAHPRLQSDPHDHGSGCNQARHSSQIDQLQRHHSIVGGFPATHCILLRTRRRTTQAHL